jgi:hypothetical protein
VVVQLSKNCFWLNSSSNHSLKYSPWTSTPLLALDIIAVQEWLTFSWGVTAESLACLSAALVVFHSSVPKESTREPEIISIIVHSEKLKDGHPLEYGQTSIRAPVADFARIGSKKSVSYIHWPREVPLCGSSFHLKSPLCGLEGRTLQSVVPWGSQAGHRTLRDLRGLRISEECSSKVGGGQMMETKNHCTLRRLLQNTQKSLWKSLYSFMVERWFVDDFQ